MSKYRVVNPVHETFFEGDSFEACKDWIESFAADINAPVIVTGETTFMVRNFNLIIFTDGGTTA
jgi:hypothetical protein